jgi:hypothetical protein
MFTSLNVCCYLVTPKTVFQFDGRVSLSNPKLIEQLPKLFLMLRAIEEIPYKAIKTIDNRSH